MDRNARPPCKWFGLLAPSSVLLTMTLGTTTLQASPIDDERQPEPSVPSAYYDEPADEAAALNAILTLPEANADSFDLPDGVKGSRDTTRTENILPPAMQTSFNYPTNGKPSPLFGAQPFTQQMVLFEAFGPDLVGVTRQRDLAWLNRWIREPDRMLAEKDPLALALFERFDKIPMPNLRLDENAAQSILGFLQEETDRQQPLQAAQVP
ncbi:hypothetical protein FBY05_10812 [Pseudomonas sp. SJZ083]|nr:hypothetical protein FBY05_10812 [Pseudomonas sp. SJZ083]TWC48135.1 hypothetical protein FBY01_108237 [Pseudomonas sp. SJZ077]